MTGLNGTGGCARTSWIVAAIIGVIAFVLLNFAADWPLLTALIAGVVVFVVLGFLFGRLLCGESRSGAASAPTSAPMHKPQAAPAAAVEPEPALSTVPDVTEDSPQDSIEPAVAAADLQESSNALAADLGPADTPELVRPSAHLPGESDLAERKGTWRYTASETDADTPEATIPAAAPAADTAPEPEPEPAPAPKPAPAPAAPDTPEGPLVKPSTPLAGEADLASRKGTWRYRPPAASAGEDYDRDGVIEGTDEGKKPEMLSGPRDGGADDLKQVKGIGPKLERLCNSLGIYHFDQIAAWTGQEIAWVDANLEGFKGRVSRDEWVAQAKVLAEGGTTEFSARVKDGGVY